MKDKNTVQELREKFEHDLTLKVKLLDVTADSVLVHNSSGDIIYVNNAGCRMRGYSREEILKLHMADLVAPGYVDFAKQQIDSIWNKGFAEFEITQRRKDGSVFVMEVCSSILSVGEEKVAMGFGRDITERKKMETELQESEERFRNFALMSPVGIYLSDVQGCYQYVNKRWCEIAGLSPLEASGEGWIKGVHPDDRERIRAAWSQFVKTGGKWIAEYRFQNQNGKVTWVYGMVTPLHDEQERISGFLGTNSDITELKNTEAALKFSETRFRELFSNMSSGVAVYEAVNNGEDFVFKSINKSSEKIDQVKEKDLIGKSVSEVFPGVKEFGLFNVFKRVWQTGIPERHPVSLYADQRISGWRDNYVYKLPSGEIVAMYDDVTERKQAEEERDKLAKFPAENPFPVLRIAKDGKILYANKASSETLTQWQSNVGEMVPERWLNLIRKVYESQKIERVEEKVNGTIFLFAITPILEAGYVNLYGRDITDRKKAEEAANQHYLKLQKTLEGTINALAITTENRDPYTAGHQRRVADLAFHISREMGLPEEQSQGLKLAGLIHDIGKISIPLEILNKPGKLSEAEFTLIKGHSQVGYDILKDIEFGWPIAQIVLQHHERINGSGYPGKIGDGDILLESKILGVADVIEAMASDRPYRPALGVDAALEEINQKKGQLYDSQIVDICNRLFREKGYKFD